MKNSSADSPLTMAATAKIGLRSTRSGSTGSGARRSRVMKAASSTGTRVPRTTMLVAPEAREEHERCHAPDKERGAGVVDRVRHAPVGHVQVAAHDREGGQAHGHVD